MVKRPTQLAATAILVFCTGCGYVRQLTSPNLAKLYSIGATTIPDRDEFIDNVLKVAQI